MKKNPSGFGTWDTDSRGYELWRLRVGGSDIVIKRKSMADLKTAVKAKLNELEENGFLTPAKDDLTVRQVLTRWLEHRVKPNRESATYASYEQTCRLYIFPAIGKVKVSKLRGEHVQQLVAYVQALPGRNDRPLSAHTVRYAPRVLMTGLGRKRARGLMDDVELPAEGEGRDRILAHEEIDKVLLEADRTRELVTRPGTIHLYRDRHLLRLLLNCGVRISEALGVMTIDVNLRDGLLSVCRQLVREKGADGKSVWRVKPKLKGRRNKRLVPLTADAADAIRAQLAMIEMEKHLAGAGYDDQGLLFPSESGRPQFARNVRRSLDRIIEKAKIENVTIHDLRRSFGTHLATTEPRMHIVAAIMGHEKIETTMKHYVWAQEQEKREAMVALRIGAKKQIDTTIVTTPAETA